MGDFKLMIERNAKSGLFDCLEISGRLTISEIEDIYQELINQLNSLSDCSRIVIHNVKEIDITFMQMIESLKLYWKKNAHPVKVDWQLTNEQLEFFKRVGFSAYL